MVSVLTDDFNMCASSVRTVDSGSSTALDPVTLIRIDACDWLGELFRAWSFLIARSVWPCTVAIDVSFVLVSPRPPENR